MNGTIIIGVVAVILFIIAGAGFLIYSLITSKNIMNGETKTKALDVFVYLGIGIMLVMSVTNLLQIIFTAIDRKFPDILNGGDYIDIYSSDVRLAIASLVVMYPLYIALSWYTSKDIAKFLYKRDLTIRKVVIYTTLFITACTLIGTLVSIIYTYLGGELSARFGWKALAVFLVACAVGWYYLYSMRRDYAEKNSISMIATVLVTALVVGSIAWSVSVIGTPAEMRAKRIDSQRLSDLSSIQQQVFNFFQTTEKLPATTAELNNAFQGYSVPVDPVSESPYKYKVLQQPVVKVDNYSTNKKVLVTNAVFEICANFDIARETEGNTGMGGVVKISSPLSIGTDSMYSVSNYYYDGDQSPFWNHGVGETCFKRVISSDMYYGGR